MIAIVFIIIFVFYKNNRYSIFHIIIIYLALALIDTLFPSILWSIYGYESKPIWLDPFTNDELLTGLLYYFIFYTIMIFSIIIFSQAKYKPWLFTYRKDYKYMEKRMQIFLMLTGVLFLTSLLYEISSYGGITEWLFNKFTIRFNPNPSVNTTILDVFLKFIPWRLLFNTFVFLAFLFRYKYEKPKLYGIFLPLIAILFAITTSYRGSVLILLLGIIFIEYVRITIHKQSAYTSLFGKGIESIHRVKYYIFGGMIVSAFLIYGAIRDSYVNDVLDVSDNEKSIVYQVFSQGSGLQGISSIVKHYGNDLEFLYGKTYIDMLLLPIPRFIYTSKPDWYGIDDITRAMEWPESTQSAVTMPGEAYANFGWAGLIIAGFYGLLLGTLLKFINKTGGVFIVLYSSIIIPVVFVSNWMSFTGIMNMFFSTIWVLVCLFLVSKKLHIRI